MLIEPDELEAILDDTSVLVVDLCKAKQYRKAHIPGAHFVNYADILRAEKPVMGLLPTDEQFSKLVSNLGIGPDTRVIAYDDEGGGCASRLIWTLHVFGHHNTALLNGGLFSWANEGHPLSKEVPAANASDYRLADTGKYTADRQYIIQHLADEHVVLLDARSLSEYHGAKKYASRGGHIPGAKQFEWTDGMDRASNLRLLPEATLRHKLDALGITHEKEVIVYCQTNHRSAFSYVMLRILGYENVKAYPGSWSEWGNREDTPVEQ